MINSGDAGSDPGRWGGEGGGGGTGWMHMKEKGFLVERIKIEPPRIGEYGCDVEHPPHTRIKRITLGMRLRIKPSERGYDYT